MLSSLKNIRMDNGEHIQTVMLKAVLWIRIDPELLPGSGIIVPDSAKYEKQIKKTVISR